MDVYLLRHGRTSYNAEHRYQGCLDIPLSSQGVSELRRADFDPEVVYVSSLQRTVQTARVLFPDARLVPVPDLREMDFGAFQGRTADEMARDPAYQVWVDGGCEGRCPGGETRVEFADRVCRAFAQLVDQALAAGEPHLVIVAHGGTQMAAMERFAEPRRPYYKWCANNASGYRLDTARWGDRGVLDLVDEPSYWASPQAPKASFWEELVGSDQGQAPAL